MKTKATVFHDIRAGNRIFLCIIEAPNLRNCGMDDIKWQIEVAKQKYSVERELPADCTPETIKALVAEMANESGLELELSEILKSEMGL